MSVKMMTSKYAKKEEETKQKLNEQTKMTPYLTWNILIIMLEKPDLTKRGETTVTTATTTTESKFYQTNGLIKN